MPESAPAYAVVMAGGWGERLWPLVTPERPKAALQLGGASLSLLAETVRLVESIVPPERVYVATGEAQADALRQSAAGTGGARILVEPVQRDTAGCVVYALASLLALGAPDDAVVGFLASDCVLPDGEAFVRALDEAYAAARAPGRLVCIGVPPTRSDPALGYLELDLEEGGALRVGDVCPVQRLVEKPGLAEAQRYVSSGRYLWNTGTVVARIDSFRSAMAVGAPGLAAAVEAASSALSRDDPEGARDAQERIEPRSVDFALLEGADLCAVVSTMPWDTVSDWGSMGRLVESDEHGNALHGHPLVDDCADSVIYVDDSAATREVAVIGVRGLVVVVTESGVLVVPKDRAQEARTAAEAFRDRRTRQRPTE